MSPVNRLLPVTLLAAVSLLGADAELFSAIRKNDLAAVRTLVRNGAAANTKDSDGATPLMQAALSASPEVVKFLLDSGADPNAANAAGVTALLWGIGDIRKVRLLLEKGANVNARSKAGKTPLLLAAGYSGSVETVRLLLAKGADLAAKDEGEANAVVLAAESGDVEVLRLLLDKGGDPNSRAGAGFNETRFGTLVSERLEQSRKLSGGYTALIVAMQQGNREAARLLLERGADAKAVTGGGVTALHEAAKRGDAEIVRTLLDQGAPVNRKDFEGNTPLLVAAASDAWNGEVVRALLAKGADVKVNGAGGRTALGWAKTKGETEIVKILKAAGAAE